MKNKKIIIIVCSIIVLFGLVFATIKLTSTGSGNLVKTNKGNVKIVASKASKIEFEDYENDALSMKKPKGWEVTFGGDGMFYTISVYDKENPINKIYLMLKIQPLLKSDSAKKAWQNYASLSGNSSTYKIYTTAVVLNNPTVKEFYSKFNDVTDFLKGIDSTYNTVKFPVLNNFDVVEEFDSSASMKSHAMDSKVLRATFKDANGKEGEGIFTAYVYDVGSYYVLENIISGKQIDIQYLNVYDAIFITAPKDEFIDWQDTLNTICSSLKFTDTFINGFNQQQDAVMKNFQQIRAIGNEISDGIMDSWNKRNTSFDIMSQKQSDATLGYERVYDTETNEIYKAYNGFTDDYDGERYKPITDDMYSKKTSGIIEK